MRGLLPLMLTCRRLATVGYSSVQCISIELAGSLDVATGSPPSSGGELLSSIDGQRMARRLGSLCAYLSRVYHVSNVVLNDCHPSEYISIVWWGVVLPALAYLPIRSLSVRGAAVSMLAPAAQIGRMPLRRLNLSLLDFSHLDHVRGAAAVVGRHQRTLKNRTD